MNTSNRLYSSLSFMPAVSIYNPSKYINEQNVQIIIPENKYYSKLIETGSSMCSCEPCKLRKCPKCR